MMQSGPAPSSLFLTVPLLAQMKRIEGWLEDTEADLLIAAVRAACALGGGLSIVEIGSYCGRSTIVLASAVRAFGDGAKVHSIDPQNGKLGAADQELSIVPSSRERFHHNIEAAGVSAFVEAIHRHSWEVEWRNPIGLLFVDGLHDYANVARDFWHFEPHLVQGAFVAFHGYADYYPGVVAFVNELLAGHGFELVHIAGTMGLVRRIAVPVPIG